MTQYIASLLWGLVVMLSFFGWGAGFVRVVGDFEERPSKFLSEYFAYKATLGMAVLVVLGGVLNLLGVISPELCVAIVVGGAGWAAKEIFCYCKKLPKKAADKKYLYLRLVLWTLVGVIASIYYLGNSWNLIYNATDDYQAYMPFIQKMLQNGSLGDDPFNQRRLEASLGGQYFLHTLFVAILGNESLNLLDGSVGIVLLMSMAYAICKEQKIPALYIPFFLLTILCFRYVICNISSIRTSFLITMCVFSMLLRMRFSNTNLLRRGITFALLIAAAWALKQTNMPAMGLLFASYYTISFLRNREKRVLVAKEAALVGVLIIIFLLPWLIALRQSSGTYLYPILGLGYSGYGYYPDFNLISAEEMSPERIITKLGRNLWSFYLPIIAGLLLAAKSGAITRKKVPVITAILITVVGMNIAFSWLDRYYESTTYPAMFVICLWGLGAFFHAEKKGKFTKRFSKRVFAFLVIILVWLTLHNVALFQKQIPSLVNNIRLGIYGQNLDNKKAITRYWNLLNSVPKGAIVMTRLDKPYLLDFTQHEVWLNDWPGGASLPPGLPYKQKDGEALAAYLLSKNIRYVAYSYNNSANFGVFFKKWLAPTNKFAWGRTTAKHTYDFQETLMNLSRKRQHIYDDSKIFILDLAVVVRDKESL